MLNVSNFVSLLLLVASVRSASECVGTVFNDDALTCVSAVNVTLNHGTEGTWLFDRLTSVSGVLRIVNVRQPVLALVFAALTEARSIVIDDGLLWSVAFPNLTRCDHFAARVSVPPTPTHLHTAIDLPRLDACLSLNVTAFVNLSAPALVTADVLGLQLKNISTVLPSLALSLQGIVVANSFRADAVSFPQLTSTGSLVVTGGSVTAPLLDNVMRHLSAASADASIVAPRLGTVGLSLFWHPPILDFPQLVSVGGSLCVALVSKISLPRLARVGSPEAAGVAVHCDSSPDMLSLTVAVANGVALHLQSLAHVVGRTSFFLGENATLNSSSLATDLLFVSCFSNVSAEWIDLSGVHVANGTIVSCPSLNRLLMGGNLSLSGGVTFRLGTGVSNISAFANVQKTDRNKFCYLGMHSVCHDELWSLSYGWNCDSMYIDGMERCFTCGNGALNFGELCDGGVSRGCVLERDCVSRQFNATTCTCLVPNAAPDASDVNAGVYITVAALALIGIGGAIGLLLWRRRRRGGASLSRFRRL
jgi:hypothetical protein